jgi:hypothetical protein
VDVEYRVSGQLKIPSARVPEDSECGCLVPCVRSVEDS